MKPITASAPSVTPVIRSIRESRVVFLVGFMGAGKTTVGQALARRLGWIFEDLDDRIEQRQRGSIAKIFQDSGEAEFRRAESAALRALLEDLGSSPRIIALGGGAFTQAENAALLESAGVPIVFLDGSPEELFRRCQREGRDRPLRGDQKQFCELYERRRPSYLKAAWHINTDGKDQETIAGEVACSLRLE
ncbi:MAG TPA: shikimate kinase [Terriglobales bacterium]|nr:shikimate kinase [Terriglobales bacterium]